MPALAARRRYHPNPHHNHRRCPRVPSALPLAAGLLLLACAASFLSLSAPPLQRDDEDLSSRRVLPGRYDSSVDDETVENPVDQQRSVTSENAFRVPRYGEIYRDDLWSPKLAKYFYGCSNSTSRFQGRSSTLPDRYLMVATSGGLNQQRTGIIDAVVAASILNATLVVPKLDKTSFWKDASNFGDIFDVDWFISFLSDDIEIVKELPKRGGKTARVPYTMRVPRKCSQRCYLNRVLPAIIKKHVIQLTKFDYRLANKLDSDLQKLRCRVNYHALKFTNQIQEMGDTLVQRMKSKAKQFIALHLRFEPDMLAFSGCYYGGGEKERRELGAIRKRWKTLHISNPEKERRHGKCPLTPEEIGLMLRALGFGDDVHLYVASGEIYGEDTLAPLKELFPNFHTKETLTSKEELAPFSSYSSRMAALDFIVCDESDAFVTNNNGNMAKILAGRRRYFGHKRTIRPNAKKLYSLLLNRTNMLWEDFASKVRISQKGFMGDPKEVRPGRGEFHENPMTCICEAPGASEAILLSSRAEKKLQKESLNAKAVGGEPTYPTIAADVERDKPDMDFGDYTPRSKDEPNATELDYDVSVRPEDSELEELLSD